MKTLDEAVATAHNLAVEARIRAGMMKSDFRRRNIARTRRAQRAASRLARIAADLASAAFQASDLLEAEVRALRNRCE
jgi:hypothetical protein